MKSRPIEKFNKILISRQFATCSLLILAALLTVSVTLPDLTLLSDREVTQLQQSRPLLAWVSEKFQVYQFTRSPFFLVLPSAIWLSIMLCTIRRLRSRLARPVREQTGEKTIQRNTPLPSGHSFSCTVEKIQTVLKQRRWKLEERQENGCIRLFAKKGTHGFWGSVVFHLSMLVFLLGIIVSYLARFDAQMILTEGQTLPLAENQLLRIDRSGIFSPKLPGTQVTLREFKSKFVQGKYPVDYAADLNLSDAGAPPRQATVRVNKPLKVNQWKMFLYRYGLAPKFQISGENGTLLCDSFVNLVVSEPGKTDYFDVYSTPLRVESTFLAPSQKENASAAAGEKVSGTPAMRVRMLESGKTLGEQDILLGQNASFGNYKITFADLRHWAWFGISYDPGYGVMVAAFLLCAAGLSLRFLILEKWLQVKVWERENMPVVSLTGGSRYFPELFQQEVGKLCLEMQSGAGMVKVENEIK